MFSLLRLSAHHLALAVSAPKIWNSITLSLRTCTSPEYLSSSPQDPLRPSNLLNSSPLSPQIRILLTIVPVYKLHLLTYLLTYVNVLT